MEIEMTLRRRQEIAVISDLVDHAMVGGGESLLIEGTIGIGKTQLLRAAVTSMRASGFHVVTARARSFEQAMPYGLAYQIAQQLVGAHGTHQQALSRWWDEPTPERAGRPGSDDSRPQLLHQLVSEASTLHPLLIAVDDVQWADRLSLQWLDYLMARLDCMPVIVIGTRAVGDPAADQVVMAEFIASFRHRFLLRGLDNGEIAELINDVLDTAPDAEFTRACLAATGGVPFLLQALLRVLQLREVAPDRDAVQLIAELGPAEVAGLVLARCADGNPDIPRIATAVAVLDGPAEPGLVAELAELDQTAVTDTMHALAVSELLIHTADGYYFAQPIVRTALRNRLAPSERARLHARAAGLLHAAGAAGGRVAEHLLRTGQIDDCWQCETLHQSAESALGGGELTRARRYLHRAVEVCRGCLASELHRSLGRVTLGTDPNAAVQHFEEALRLRQESTLTSEPFLDLAHAQCLAGQPRAAATLLRRTALETADSNPRVGLAMDVERQLIELVYLGETGEVGTPEVQLPRQRCRRPHRPSWADLVLSSVRSCWHGCSREAAVGQARQALDSAPRDVLEHSATRLLPLLVLATADELDLALTGVATVLDSALSRNSRTLVALARNIRAEVHYRNGDLGACRADAEAALDLGVPPEGPWLHTGTAAGNLVGVLVEQGELAAAYDVLSRLELMGELPEQPFFALVLYNRGRLNAAAGNLEAAAADFFECGWRLERMGLRNPAACPWRTDAALVQCRLGDSATAARLVDQELRRAREWGAPRGIGIALRATALVAKGPERESLLEEAARVLESTGARLELARTLLDLGMLMRQSHRLPEARERLRAAHALAEKCGARPLVRAAGQELLAVGARPRRATSTGVAALTPTERRVALMAAEGLTNRQIAEGLYVTRRTVEIHLSRAYQKLLIPGRAQLTSGTFADPEKVKPETASIFTGRGLTEA